jgi:uncharacterized protein YndB with AHSA1/START domain
MNVQSKQNNTMPEELTLNKSLLINAPAEKVWEALTDRELIKEYFFGTDCITDWKKGSPIIYRGEWEGETYEDHGNVLDIEDGKFIRYNYWSSFNGTEDRPENYAEITYELMPEKNDSTLLIITQGGFKNEETLKHSEDNWMMVMNAMKEMIES